MRERPAPGQTWELEGKLLLVLASPNHGSVRCLVLEDPSGLLEPGHAVDARASNFLSNEEMADQIFEGSTLEEREAMTAKLAFKLSRSEPRRVT